MLGYDRDGSIEYDFIVGGHKTPLNPLLGKKLQIEFVGQILCMHCQKATKKSFAQGYCFRCMQKLPYCDKCMVRPELCHYAQGTCRDSKWGEANCLQDHFVYLSNTSSIKVGITRGVNIPTRWIDQGAEQAIPIIKVDQRLLSGKLEMTIKQWVADKTNWRKMLISNAYPIYLVEECRKIQQKILPTVIELQQQYGLQSIALLDKPEMWQAKYPICQYPQKIISLNPEKEPVVSGKLMGIKGQYLLFDIGVINIRKYRGYKVKFSYENIT